MAYMVGCAQRLSLADARSSTAIASCSAPKVAAQNVAPRRRSARPLHSAASIAGAPLVVAGSSARRGALRARGVPVRASESNGSAVGENPEWSDDDFVAVGLAHCFRKDENQKLKDALVVEPIPAGGLECMDNGGVTCYMHAVGTTLGVALKQDASLLPTQFAGAEFCEEYDFRTRCASRTWKRDHARQHLMDLLPRDGGVRSDWNFRLVDKRILNQENIVKDSDNIKQDMSIDVYGRTESEEEMSSEIGQLYNA